MGYALNDPKGCHHQISAVSKTMRRQELAKRGNITVLRPLAPQSEHVVSPLHQASIVPFARTNQNSYGYNNYGIDVGVKSGEVVCKLQSLECNLHDRLEQCETARSSSVIGVEYRVASQ